MSRANWIVCEQTGRWTTAVRAALSRQNWPQSMVPRVVEVRSLAELTARLDSQPDILALIEVRPANALDALQWLADASRSYPHARFVGLVERGIEAVVDTLREAGAMEVIASPRQMQGVLELEGRHARWRAAEFAGASPQTPIEEWVRASLPWQDE